MTGARAARATETDAPRSPCTSPRAGTVYLLHFSRPYYHAQHYLGWTTDLERRLRKHRAGRGSPLVRAAVTAGIEFSLARTWENVTRAFELRMHKDKRRRSHCPLCREKTARGPSPRRDPKTGVGW